MPETQEKEKSELKRAATMARWDSVEDERDLWIRPFRELPPERALRYLETLRSVCEEGGKIVNTRINDDKKPKHCAWRKCKKLIVDRQVGPNTTVPGWIAQVVEKDKRHPEIHRSLFFCSELCKNQWTREGDGARGSTG